MSSENLLLEEEPRFNFPTLTLNPTHQQRIIDFMNVLSLTKNELVVGLRTRCNSFFANFTPGSQIQVQIEPEQIDRQHLELTPITAANGVSLQFREMFGLLRVALDPDAQQEHADVGNFLFSLYNRSRGRIKLLEQH